MFEKLKNIGNDRKTLIENLTSLFVLQGANYLLPLITLPYLLRTLGPEKYGLIIFSQAIIQYFIMVTEYGFNLSATREISINRQDKKKVSEIFSTVFVIKFILMILSLFVLTLIIYSFDRFRSDALVYYATFGMVIGNVLFPVWYFQGIEKMKFITVLNLISKVVYTILLFLLVKNQSDFILVPLINSTGMIFAGCLSLLIISDKFSVKIALPPLNSIKFHLKEGWYVFISTISISLYTVTNTFLLGMYTSNEVVGYYAAAEKVVQAFQNILVPISQTIYPHINNIAQQSKQRAIRFIKKSAILVGCFSLFISVAIFTFSKTIIIILFGETYTESIIILKILAFLPFIIAMSNIFGTQTLLVFNFKRIFSISIIVPAVIHVALIFWLIPYFGMVALASMTVITETLVTSIMVIGITVLHRSFFWEGSKNGEKIENSI